jgi:amino acid adenylation domain-containing protein
MAYLFHQLLNEASAADPDGEAVRFHGRSTTWRELEAASNGIARALVDAGVRRGDRVGIYLPKRPETLAAVFGTLKAGATFVGLDVHAPVERSSMIALDCAVKALVSTPSRATGLIAELGSFTPDVVILVDDGTGPVDLPGTVIAYGHATADPGARDPDVHAVDLDIATLVYTSGSTGVPKGVMRSHLSCLHSSASIERLLEAAAEDRFLSILPLHFVGGVMELGVWLRSRGTYVILPQDEAFLPGGIVRALHDERITAWMSLPPAFMILLQADMDPGSFPLLRKILYGGATFPTKYVRVLRRLVPDAEIWHVSGSSEASLCTAYRVDEIPQDAVLIPVGRPSANHDVILVKEDGTLAGVGEEGEMYARHAGIFSGYWNDPERTAERLVPNPLAPHLAERVCRTGDIVRLLPDGNFEWVGRRDHQIKTRGYRVDLGEVEAVIQTHPAVGEAVVVAVPHPEWEKALVACVVRKEGGELDEAELKSHIGDRLPLYMVPARIAFLSEMPRGHTGKADRTRLLEEMSREPIRG